MLGRDQTLRTTAFTPSVVVPVDPSEAMSPNWPLPTTPTALDQSLSVTTPEAPRVRSCGFSPTGIGRVYEVVIASCTLPTDSPPPRRRAAAAAEGEADHSETTNPPVSLHAAPPLLGKCVNASTKGKYLRTSTT